MLSKIKRIKYFKEKNLPKIEKILFSQPCPPPPPEKNPSATETK